MAGFVMPSAQHTALVNSLMAELGLVGVARTDVVAKHFAVARLAT